MPFESLGAVSYSPSIVILAVSVAVCEIFSAKEWCDRQKNNRVTIDQFALALMKDSVRYG